MPSFYCPLNAHALGTASSDLRQTKEVPLVPVVHGADFRRLEGYLHVSRTIAQNRSDPLKQLGRLVLRPFPTFSIFTSDMFLSPR
jgi:hypothetical protein